VSAIRAGSGAALFAVFMFWQVVPLFTLTGGWSLQLDKLLVYPISTSAFFGIEVTLRLTTAFEMIYLIVGSFVGLLQHRDIPLAGPLWLLLYIPFNLFVSLFIRGLLLHSFQRRRFRELFAVLIISIGVLPQLFLRTELGARSRPFLRAASEGQWAPWHVIGMLSSGVFSVLSAGIVLAWIALAYAAARWQFARSLKQEATLGPGRSAVWAPEASMRSKFADLTSRLFADPMAALVDKEFRTLLRMPRFRVVLGMACFFSVVVFFPMALGRGGAGFLKQNFLTVVNLYGLLILGDALFWNVFGFDRAAAQIYFIAPISLQTVVRAKNLAAGFFIFVQAMIVFLIALALRLPMSRLGVLTSFSASAVAGIFLISAGNLSSSIIPRPIDPSQTLRKQAGGQVQLWLLGCSVAVAVLVGFAYLAQWALQKDWAAPCVLALEFAIGLVIHGIAIESATNRLLRDRERILQALSKGSAPVSA
jgi:ABC-2 type transport system permease protein